MNAKLVAEEGSLKELVLSFEEGDHWVIGRDPDACQLLVEDPATSRQHALCRKTTHGIVIENLSKINPTLVNDEPLTEPRVLQQGDSVKIGDTLFRFYVEEDTATNLNEVTPTEEPEPTEKEHDTIFGEEEEKSDLAKVSFDLTDTGRWLLKVVGGPNNGAEFSMHTGESYVIGTDSNVCDIVFYDTSVSRQHVRISITPEDQIFIEDLRSRNGTRIEGELLTDKQQLPLNTLVSLGTSSFVVYDREGEMQTIISPLLPSIVKTLQKEEEDKKALEQEAQKAETGGATPVPPPVAPVEVKKPPSHALGTFILVATLIGVFAMVGVGINSLFTQHEIVVVQTVNIEQELQKYLSQFPGLKYSFNKNTGRLLLVGHVATSADKNEILYNLQSLKYVTETDDSGVIIDEYVWNEGNQLLSRNPLWRGITVHSPSPGKFVLTGYLHTRSDAEQLWDYMTRNFSYPDLLEDKVVVEEDILTSVKSTLKEHGYPTVSVQLANGELTLTGGVPTGSKADLDKMVEEFRSLPGVRSVKNYAAEVAKQDAVINVSDRYTISGISKTSDGGLNVVINGRILSKGDVLDGMTIISIQPNMVLLDKDNVTYRVDVAR